MLHLIIGRSGYGKTEYMWKNIEESIAQGRKIIILVPEQFSFVNEKRVCEIQSKNPYANVEVLSFTRLSTMIFREYGGISGASVTDSASNMIMAMTLEQLKDDLKIYRRHLNHSHFIKSMVEAMKILKQYNIVEDKIKILSSQIDEGFLRSKLNDLSRIYEVYQSKVDIKYFDTSNGILRACEKLESNPNFFEDYLVYVDGFRDFSECEYDMLKYVIAGSLDVYVALCIDSKENLMQDKLDDISIFRRMKSTANRLLEIANKENVKVAEIVKLSTPHRFKNDQLRALENGLTTNIRDSEKYDLESKLLEDSNIKIIEMDNQYAEVEYIASEIWNFVRDKGYRFKDILIIVRDLSVYQSIIENVFEVYRIPYFLDERKGIEYKSIIVFILSSLSAIKAQFNTIQILKILKTGFFKEDQELISQLELYCNVWNIRGDMWCKQFVFNPRGFKEVLSDEDKLLLEGLNSLRERVIGPLLTLKSKTRGKISSKQFVRAVYEYLIELNVPEKLSDMSLSFNQLEEDFKDESVRVWDALMNILDEIDAIAPGEELNISKYTDLLQIAVSSTDLGLVPQTLDQVIVGRVDRIVPSNPKVVFVMGMNQGIFPSSIQNDKLFSQQEQKQLYKIGVKLLSDKLEKSIDERYYAYLALTCAGEYVCISYCRNSKDGTAMQKSNIVDQIEKMFPNLKVIRIKDNSLHMVQNIETAYSYLCRNYKDKPEEYQSIEYCLTKIDDYGCKIESFEKIINYENIFLIEDQKIIKGVLGNKLKLYPSSIERFHLCRFKFLCNDVLNIRNIKKAEINHMESGTIIHHILRKMLEDYLKDRDKKSNTQDLTDQDLTNQDLTNQDLTNQDLTVMIQYYLDEYINNIMGGCNGKDNRFMYLYKNLRKNLETALNYLLLEIESSEFKPYKLEMDIDWDKEVQPLTLETLEGEQIVISGKIDRVDVFEKDGEKYIRIIDYKSGNKRFNLEDINYGLNMQMMLYLLILCQCGKGDLRGVKPAGILYMPVQRKVVTGRRGYNSEQIEKYHMDNMKMSGIMSDDIEILNAMEKGIEGKFIPAKLKKDGALSSTSSVVKINEMHKLMINIKDIVLNMAESIYCGDLPAVPTDHSKYDVCSYCEYKSICKKSGGNE